MEVICENCKTKLNIPDEKIPQGQRVVINCPKCQHKVTLDARVPKEEEAAPAQPRADAEDDIQEDDTALDFYEERGKIAILMESDPARVEGLTRAAEELEYKYIVAQNTREAIAKMRFHHFDLVILSDGFDGVELGQSPIIQFMNNLSMTVRRRTFLALIGDTFKTTDNMMAFAMSANLVINWKDLDKITSILRRAISDNEKFYKVFIDTLVEVGKA